MAPCMRALSYIYNETLSKDINAKIETRSQDEIPSFTQAEYTTGWSMGGVIMPKNKIKTWRDKNLRNDFKYIFKKKKTNIKWMIYMVNLYLIFKIYSLKKTVDCKFQNDFSLP